MRNTSPSPGTAPTAQVPHPEPACPELRDPRAGCHLPRLNPSPGQGRAGRPLHHTSVPSTPLRLGTLQRPPALLSHDRAPPHPRLSFPVCSVKRQPSPSTPSPNPRPLPSRPLPALPLSPQPLSVPSAPCPPPGPRPVPPPTPQPFPLPSKRPQASPPRHPQPFPSPPVPLRTPVPSPPLRADPRPATRRPDPFLPGLRRSGRRARCASPVRVVAPAGGEGRGERRRLVRDRIPPPPPSWLRARPARPTPRRQAQRRGAAGSGGPNESGGLNGSPGPRYRPQRGGKAGGEPALRPPPPPPPFLPGTKMAAPPRWWRGPAAPAAAVGGANHTWVGGA